MKNRFDNSHCVVCVVLGISHSHQGDNVAIIINGNNVIPITEFAVTFYESGPKKLQRLRFMADRKNISVGFGARAVHERDGCIDIFGLTWTKG